MKKMDIVAAEMIPIRLIISITIIAVILVMIGVGSLTLRTYLAEHQVEQQCRLLESTLSTMVGSGVARDVDEVNTAEGTKRVQTFILPDSLVFICFGGDPDLENNGGRSPGLTEDGASIFYQIEGGSKHVMWLPKETYKFREGTYTNSKWVIAREGQSYILQGGGKTTLVFELVQKNHVNYILIKANDGIEP